MKNQKIIEFQCKLRYEKLIETAGVGEIIDFKYGEFDGNINQNIRKFGLKSSQPYSKLRRDCDDLILQEWFYTNIEDIAVNCNEFWLITSGDIAWISLHLSNPISDLFRLWIASSKSYAGVTKDFRYCFGFSTYEYEYEFHKEKLLNNTEK